MKKILVAEDEAIIAMVWKEALEDAGYSVTTSQTGLQTLGHLRGEKFDLLITDLNMPDGGGFLVASEINRLNDKIPLIVVSGDPQLLNDGALEKMTALGADAVAVKPITTDKLLQMVQEVKANGREMSLAGRLKSLFEF